MIRTASILASAAFVGCALCALAQPAFAQMSDSPTTGPYVSLGAGAQWLEDAKTRNAALNTKYKFDVGPAVIGALGYGLGNGFRVEGEIGYRDSSVKSGSGSAKALDFMGNALYDFHMGWPVTPYVGGGIGFARVNFDGVGIPTPPGGRIDDTDSQFAYQGLAGVAYAINQNLKLDVGYRYFATTNPHFKSSVGTVGSEYRDHTLLVALRWEFGAPPPPPAAPMQPAAVTPPPPAPPAPQIQRSYLVFFDFDKSDITPEAQRVIQQAAANAKQGSVSRIQATGHTDRAGTETYNMALSIRRANAVKAALVRQGIPENEIVVIGKGETQPLVPTPDGVREPQNRRVEILLQ
ncbi:MAG TPA: outer membrane beta-barrel protein [Alphaproteobacteria bacterium]|nr:outer membrane beta-barrel protein [Alphaproteobacteria bacterium]